MDFSAMEVQCKNSAYGCTFASSSVEDMVNHFQGECAFHPLQCFKCSVMVRKMDFTEHYEQCCKDSSASPCPPPQEAPDAAEATASATATSREEHFVRECATVKSLCRAIEVVAVDVAEVTGMKQKQQDLERVVKSQSSVIQELGKSISVVVEKVNKVQEDVSGLVKRLDKDAGTIVERVENVDGLLKECARDTKLGVERLSHVIRDVAAEAAEVEAMKQAQQGMQAIMKQQGDLIKELGKNILTNAEKINKLEQGVGTIVQRVEKVGGLVEDVLKRGIAYQSKVHWYVENVSQYIEKAKTERWYVESEVYVVRGYSVKLSFKVEKRETGLRIGLFLRLCRGPNDFLLQWPFRIPHTLSLIHPKDASKSKKHKVTPPDALPHCFEKPKREENRGCGTHNLCTVEAAQKEGFIENDAVCFALTLHE